MRWVAPTEKDTANEVLEKRLCRMKFAVHGLH